jgi:NitT/TauT family transport system substrate-binding protein
MDRRQILVFLVLIPAFAGCSAPPANIGSPTEQVLRLPMGYIPNVQFSPFYLADSRGYFADEGLKVDFDYAFETDGVSLVGAGQLPFALASGEQVLLARQQGLPVVYVMAWWHDFPVAVVAPAGGPIQTPQDLAGAHVGIPALSGASLIGYQALLAANHLPPDAATLDVIGFNQVQAMLAGTIDAAVVYANNEPIVLEDAGMSLNEFRVADYVTLASNGLITNEQTLKENPDLVRRMIRATLRGVSDALADPDAAYEVSKGYVDGLGAADQDIQRKVLDATLPFWRTDRPGYSVPRSWSNMQDVLLQMGLLRAPLDLSAAYSNGYLP